MTTILGTLRRDLAAVAVDDVRPMSREPGVATLAVLRSTAYKQVVSTDDVIALDFPVAGSDMPGFAIPLVAKPA